MKQATPLATAADLAVANSRLVRCAIYTRKSTEEGLDQEFNSLDAQRESAEAFVLSQRSEGLVAVAQRYDDGGFSGGNIERPALKRLLDDIAAGAVDCVIVYKVDRLSRSLIDFARIIEIFERHKVSFVSVTQQFNTTNSLGRLTLNILLSFAQFEREIIAERTRDKLSAARRRGKWIGGRPVLGYDIDGRCRRLIINADEAFQVRTIYGLYLEYNALTAVASEVNRRGWRTKLWVTKHGATQGGKPFTKGRIFRLLRNPIYGGKVRFKNQTFDGEHEPIVSIGMWVRVQEILASNGDEGGRNVRSRAVLPRGLLRCVCCGEEMIPTRCVKGPKRCRYYVCPQDRPGGRRRVRTGRVPEFEVMGVIIEEVRRKVVDPRVLDRAVSKVEEQMQTAVANLTVEREMSLRALAGPEQSFGAGGGERLSQMQMRLKEIDQELGRFMLQHPSDDVRAALVQFWRLWQSFNSRERARVVNMFIKRVTYDGITATLYLDRN